jgi:sulfite dehydrogenase (quinone) subunit SoeC
MANAFNMELRAQREWSWLLATWLFLGGTGSGLFLLFLAVELPLALAVCSLALILTGGVVLLLELGNPLRAWRTIFRAGTSWLSRGVLFVLLFVLTAAVSIGPRLAASSWLAPLDNTAFEQFFGWIAGLCALMIILYPALFFLSTSRAIPFWRTPLLPFLFVGYGLLGGAGFVLLFAPYWAAPSSIALLAVTLIAINAVMIAIYLFTMHRSEISARESVRLLNCTPLGLIFWLGVVVSGMILPVLEILLVQSNGMVAGALILLGGLLFRYCLLKAGVYIPPALVGTELDLSKLNRTSAAFEREYAGMNAQGAGHSG